MAKITKNNYVPFLKIDNNYEQIDKSTVFELSIGEEEEDYDYICYANPVTEVKQNKPELPQEIVLDEENPIYNAVLDMIKTLPVGDDCLADFMLCFPDDTDGTFKSGADAWGCQATITEKTLNTVDGKITFTIKPYGDVTLGTYTITEGTGGTKVVTFNPPTP